MLKFTAARDDRQLVGLGLSFDNLRRLPADAIQFHASELGLGDGIFVIAHAADPKLGWYRSLVGSAAREVVSLDDAQLQSMKTRGEVLELPLSATAGGKPCQALVFVGETEELLLAAFRKQGLIGAETAVSGPPELVRPEIARGFAVDMMNKLKLIAGGAGFLVATVLVVSQSHHQGVDTMVQALMLATSLAFFGLLYLRWNERIEIDSDGIRRVHPIGSFTMRWSDLSSASTKNDSLGPYELYLVPKSGVPQKLTRIYEGWDELLRELQKHL
jgi:hypothetical protein